MVASALRTMVVAHHDGYRVAVLLHSRAVAAGPLVLHGAPPGILRPGAAAGKGPEGWRQHAGQQAAGEVRSLRGPVPARPAPASRAPRRPPTLPPCPGRRRPALPGIGSPTA